MWNNLLIQEVEEGEDGNCNSSGSCKLSSHVSILLIAPINAFTPFIPLVLPPELRGAMHVSFGGGGNEDELFNKES